LLVQKGTKKDTTHFNPNSDCLRQNALSGYPNCGSPFDSAQGAIVDASRTACFGKSCIPIFFSSHKPVARLCVLRDDFLRIFRCKFAQLMNEYVTNLCYLPSQVPSTVSLSADLREFGRSPQDRLNVLFQNNKSDSKAIERKVIKQPVINLG